MCSCELGYTQSHVLMSISDIATTKICSQSNVYIVRTEKKFGYGNQKRLCFSWKSFSVRRKGEKGNSGKNEVLGGRLVVSATATFKCIEVAEVDEQLRGYQNLRTGYDLSSQTPMTTQKLLADEESAELGEREKVRRMRISQANKGNIPWNKGRKPSEDELLMDDDSAGVDNKEKLRRKRISKANKGNTPWNLGRKHSAETLQKIKERTRLAMQEPKVKMKLLNLGHAQSEETRVKIGLGVRIGWVKRREKLMLQETCYYEWQNLIANTSRRGLLGEEEMQWDSYSILSEQLEEEWLQSIEERKERARTKGDKRAPKSEEQRRKISEAISSKWADPTYRTRVVSALAKYHGIPEGAIRERKRKPRDYGEPRKRVTKKNTDELPKVDSRSKSQIQQVELRKSKAPMFRDPLASSKLHMLKNIRAERAGAENKQAKAVARAKELISESEKASKALEAVAEKSLLAQASLIETRSLIAEAKQLINSIETAWLDPHVNGTDSHLASLDSVAHSEDEELDDTNARKVNGSKSLGVSASSIYDMVPSGNNNLSSSSSDYDLSTEELNNMIKHSTLEKHLFGTTVNGNAQNTKPTLTNRTRAPPEDDEPHSSRRTTKKWVRGRLVEDSKSG